MGSMPDFEQAHRLNPDKFPKDPMKLLVEAQSMLAYVAEKYAALVKRSRSDVMDEAKKAVSGEEKKIATADVSEKDAAVKVEKDRARFFADTERSTYYPIEELDEGSDGSNIRFFESAEEAEANGFMAGTMSEEEEEEEQEEEEEEKKATKKKWK